MGLTLKFLGESAPRDGSRVALSLPTRKPQALLGYLALNADDPQPRQASKPLSNFCVPTGSLGPVEFVERLRPAETYPERHIGDVRPSP